MTLVTSLLKEYQWEEWRFVERPRWFWKSGGDELKRRFLLAFAQANAITNPAGWYKVSIKDLYSFGGAFL